MRSWLILSALASVAAPLGAQTPAALRRAAETITVEDIARHVGVIAHDSMMGRNTPSPGLEMTAQYVASHFKKLGLKPGGDNGAWIQRYPAPFGDTATAPNTVGILEGTDPQLKNEYVVFSAHMDHIGFRRGGDQPDSIFNGADDNASGTVGVMELAEAFAQSSARPRRSMIFLTVSGEEEGLWGSQYFVAHPPVPLKQMVADFNLDMIGRAQGDSVEMWGIKGSADRTALVERITAAHPELRLVLQPMDEDNGSDHVSFRDHGVPSIYPFTGEHPDYHGQGDSPEKINVDTEARLLRLVFYLAQEVANAHERLK